MVYLNGRFVEIENATVSVLDRGFIFGDGVYEVIPVYSRKPFYLDAHLARLEHSLSEIRLTNPHGRAEWTNIIAAVIEKNPEQNQSIYLQVTRGVAKRDHAFPKDTPPTVFVMSNPGKPVPAEQIEHGIACVTMPDNRWLRCHIKSTSLLSNVLLRQEAVEQDAIEALLLRDGMLSEGAASNIYAVKNGVLLAPKKDHLILPGITYDVLLELAAAEKIPFEIRDISEAEVRNADELLLSSSGKEVLAITRLDNIAVGSGRPGPLFRKLYAIFQQKKAA
ncbi:MAG: D-amino acid aminotransferase [Burkholderiales bacterium]